jgi:hypothetical protein
MLGIQHLCFNRHVNAYKQIDGLYSTKQRFSGQRYKKRIVIYRGVDREGRLLRPYRAESSSDQINSLNKRIDVLPPKYFILSRQKNKFVILISSKFHNSY